MKVEIIADSIGPNGHRLTTMALRYQRFFHAELMTHRVFSRNASSSRAIPVRTMLAQVWNNPAMPTHWGVNKPGMQASKELTGIKLFCAKQVWKLAGKAMCLAALAAMKLGGHKQWVNRMLEPWQYISVLVSGTEWENFFALRTHPDAQPEFRALAVAMQEAMKASAPKRVEYYDWHAPYSNTEVYGFHVRSVARCARVSYNKHDGSPSTEQEDAFLYRRLVNATPPHMSPTEHQAVCVPDDVEYSGNFKGWAQLRESLEKMTTEEVDAAFLEYFNKG